MKVTRTRDEVTVEGRDVRVCCARGRNMDCVEFEARTATGWRLIAASRRDTRVMEAATRVTGPTLRTAGFTAEFDQRLTEAASRKQQGTLRLAGSYGAHRMEMEITVPETGKWARVATAFHLGARTSVARLCVPYHFLPGGRALAEYGPPDFLWTPHLRKTSEHVLADQVFRSPAVMIQTGSDFCALVPDLHLLAEHRPMATALDLQLRPAGSEAPEMSYGFEPYELDGHVYFRRDLGAPPAHGTLRLGYYIFVDAEAAPSHGYTGAVRFLWETFGREYARHVEPQMIPFEEYAHYACDFAMHRGKLWVGFDMDETPVGGTLALTFTGRFRPHVMNKTELDASLFMKKLTPIVHRFGTDKLLTTKLANDLSEVGLNMLRMTVPPLVMNQAWFCNLRTAYGLYAWGERRGDFDLMEKARRMKELALRAPGRGGLFASVCYALEEGPVWYEGTQAFEPVREYHVPDCAWTAHWMLNWLEDHEKDERLERRARALAEFCASIQKPNGAIPAWVRFRGAVAEPEEMLAESAQTAAPALLLAHYGYAMRHRPSIEAAAKAAEFLIAHVFPGNRWWDFETFFSCSKKDVGERDRDTGLAPHNTLSMGWAAEAFKYLYLATRKARWLEWGGRALDTLCLYQQVWDAPYVSINTFGGFGVMNTDAEWNDARQSVFADTLLDYYRLTREAEYFERGVAALRASFTLMLAPENRSVAPGNLGRARPKDFGATYENFAHLGFDRRVPGYVMFDWGSGGACAAAARAHLRYGDVFVDGKARRAFGINGVTAEGVEFEKGGVALRLHSPLLSNRKIVVKMVDMPLGPHRVRLNGRMLGRFTSRALERGIAVELKNPELE